MRIPLATNLKTRTGAPSTKDARQVNSYMEIKGDQAAVRKRPAAQGGISIGTGTAQGGIGFSIGGTPYFIGFWGDTMQTYTGSGTSWNSGTNYIIGDHVAVNFQDFWAINNNVNSSPPSADWSNIYVPRGPTVYATWNPADKGANVTLSNGNLTATFGATESVRSTISKSAGKWYWEYTFSGAFISSGVQIGIGLTTASLSGAPGGDAFGWGYASGTLFPGTPYKMNSAIKTSYGVTYGVGDVIGIALDMDAGTIAFYVNNVNQGTAFTGLTGAIFAMVYTGGSASITANFGATALTYTPPAGYNAGLHT